MRCVLILVLCCLVWECYSSPIQIVENHEIVEKAKAVATGRQAAGSEGAAAAEDDDDDDDDDDIEGALVDDDDDDDEEDAPQGAAAADPPADDDDDDDEDYLDGILDDILDEDDDDDDDDVSPSTGIVQQTQQQAAAAVQSSISEPAVGTGLSEGEGPAGLNVDYPNEGEQTVFYDEENGGIDTKVDVQALNKPLEQAASNVAQKVSAAQQATNEVANASDDDDDDDDEDEIEGALDDDDDDDDDDEEDDLIGDDVIEAKRSRSLGKESDIPEVLTSRYNRFVDGIFARINKILKQSYDPVRVRLSVGGKQTKSKSASSKSNTNTKSRTKSKRKRTPKAEPKVDLTESKSENQVLSEEVQAPNSIPVGIPEKFITLPKQSDQVAEERATKQKLKKTAASATPKPSKNSVKKTPDEKVRKAQGTLYGLASLKRIGNVRVIPEGNNSTIKSKFTLGPLTLKVEKSFKRGTVRNVKSATARTNEMVGRINLRVVDGAATLVSIKVQQPKQVQVESSDNHDRTREFVWKRTPHIAHLVSDKLRAAARSLLKPVRTQVVVHQ